MLARKSRKVGKKETEYNGVVLRPSNNDNAWQQCGHFGSIKANKFVYTLFFYKHALYKHA